MKALAALIFLIAPAAFAQTGDELAQARESYLAGRALYRQGDYYGAAERLAEAVSLAPEKAAYHSLYGLALLKTEDYYSAADEFLAAIERGLSTAKTWNNLGMAYEHMDQLDDARSAYRKAAQKGSPYAPLHLERLKDVKSLYPQGIEGGVGCGGPIDFGGVGGIVLEPYTAPTIEDLPASPAPAPASQPLAPAIEK
jgi:tetratricopeptide (TPR) repeat protein